MSESTVAPQEPISFKSIDEAIKTYVEKRDELAMKRQSFTTEETLLKDQMVQIQMWLRDKADELGVDSFASRDYGTAFRSVKVSYRVIDFDAFAAWIKSKNMFHCLEKRCAKNAVKEVHNETGEVPPGLEHIVEVEMDVRRPTKSGAKK